jgi:hypothetical protein
LLSFIFGTRLQAFVVVAAVVVAILTFRAARNALCSTTVDSAKVFTIPFSKMNRDYLFFFVNFVALLVEDSFFGFTGSW